jgi:microcystin-dependent protein
MPKIASRGYGDAVRGLGHGKGAKVTTGRGTPTKRDGADGELTLRNTRRGVILYAKYGGRWYSIKTGGQFVAGQIIMWSGKKQLIPRGWAFCDGTRGTPDLAAKFIIGAGASNESYNVVGRTFGPDSSYAPSDLVQEGSMDADDLYSYLKITVPTVTGGTQLTALQMPSHRHGYSDRYDTGSAGHISGGGARDINVVENAENTSYTGGSGADGANGDAHTHSISASSIAAADSLPTDKLPLVDFYSLAYIMYVGAEIDTSGEGGSDEGDGGSLGRSI